MYFKGLSHWQVHSMKHSSLKAKLLKAKQAAHAQHPAPGRGQSGVWKWALVLLCITMAAGVTYAVLHFFILSKIPREMIGTWVVMEVKTTGADQADEALKGGRFDFRRDGTMICRTNMDGKGYTIKATVEVDQKTLRITSVNPYTGQPVTDVQTIRTFSGDQFVIEDRKGTVLVMERLRD
jgi:hypothetical protein